jgi:DNA-directed RNA polymerase specialized sigma24 family protein
VNVFDALAAEWRTLPHTPSNLARYEQWKAADSAFRFWSNAAELVSFAQRRHQPIASDRALALLASRASCDDLAARALLQAVEPGLRALMSRYHWLAPAEDLSASAVAWAWERIRSYPFRRRPERIAANVLLDTAYRLRLEWRSRPALMEESMVNDIEIEVGYETVELLDLITRQLDEVGTAVVLRTRLLDESVEEVASSLGCQATALRERRRRAERRLRSALRNADRSSVLERVS